MINKAVIRNFKGINTLEIELKKINLVVGRNNTCKTTILEALALISHPDIRTVGKIAENNGGAAALFHTGANEFYILTESGNKKDELLARPPTLGETEATFKSLLFDYIKKSLNQGAVSQKEDVSAKILDAVKDVAVPPALLQSIARESLSITKNGKKEVLFCGTLQTDIERHHAIKEFSNLLNSRLHKMDLLGSPALDFSLDFIIRALISPYFYDILKIMEEGNEEVSFVSDLMENLPYNQVRRGKGIEGKKRINAIETKLKENGILRNLKKLDLEDITFMDGSVLPTKAMGSGFQAIIGFLWNLSPRVHILLADEPEKYMHPGYIGQLIYFITKMASERGVQFVMVTHNLDFVLEFLSEDYDEKYLRENFQVILIEDIPNVGHLSAETSGYDAAKEKVEKIKLDLRGI